MPKADEKGRTRMVVEEVETSTPKVETPTIPLDVVQPTPEPEVVVASEPKPVSENVQTLDTVAPEPVEKPEEPEVSDTKVDAPVEDVPEPEVKEETPPVEDNAVATGEPIAPPSTNVADDFIPLNKNASGPKPLLIIIPGVLLLGALLGGVVFYQKNIKGEEPKETPVPTMSTEATPEASASPSATLDLTKYTVAILNGSGIVGEAGKVKTILTDAKFKVGTTANAATYDFTKTVVKAKGDVEAEFVTKLVETLGKTYVVDKAQTLSASSKDSVQVTVGTSKN